MLFSKCCPTSFSVWIYICKNWLPLEVIPKLELSPSQTFLTFFREDCSDNEIFSLFVTKAAYLHFLSLFKQSSINRF